jgi:hypothetical protein
MDLDCSDQTTGLASVVLSKTARLNLGTYTLTGPIDAAVYDTVRCENRCIIHGPGTISGGHVAIASRGGRSGRVDVFYTTISGAQIGILAPKVHARQIVVTGNTLEGIRSEKAKIIDSDITNNGGPGVGVRGEVVKLLVVDVTGNGYAGVEGKKLYGRHVNITGNGTDPDCGGTKVCADLSLERRPRLKEYTCGTSLDMLACSCSAGDAAGPGNDQGTHNFGVCSGD